MPIVVRDRVQETTTTVGTGSYTLGGAVTGYQAFSTIGNGNTTYYTATDGVNWEVGIGTYTSAGNTLSRDTILESSNAGSAVNWSAGVRSIFLVYPAERSVTTDAQNTFTDIQTISVNSTGNALRITQTGTGNALVVEDSANPDATPFVVTNDGRVGIGLTTPGVSLQIANETQANVTLNTGPNNSQIALRRANTSVFSPSIVASGDDLGIVAFDGYDGSAYRTAAWIRAAVDGTPGTNDMPGRLVFSTTADGASSPTERMRIDNAGRVGIGGAAGAGDYFAIKGALTGAVDSYYVGTNFTINSDVTNTATVFSSYPTTQAASFTLGSLRHFLALGRTLGAGSTVTNQYGFFAHSGLTGATNNYGFYSDIASGTGRWNFYANGTAANYFAGNTGVGSNVIGNVLTVSGDKPVRVQEASGTFYYDFGRDSATGNFIINGNQTGSLAYVFQSGGNERMRIASGGTISLGAAPGSESLRVTPVASAVNYVNVLGAATGGGVFVGAAGSDTNITLALQAKGTGTVQAYSPTGLSFSINAQTNNVNYGVFTSTATGTSPLLQVVGSDTNIDFRFRTQGTGAYQFDTGTNGNTQLRIAHTASAVNYLQATGSATGNSTGPTLSAQGSDAAVPITIQSKAHGALFFTKTRDATASSAYNFGVAGGLTSDAGGGAFWRGLQIFGPTYTIGGVNQFPRGSQFLELDSLTDPTVRNYYYGLGNTTNAVEMVFANGTNGAFRFKFTNASSSDTAFRIVPGNTQVNYLQVSGAATTAAPVLSAQGADTNIDLSLTSKGTGTIRLSTGNGEQLRVGDSGVTTTDWVNIVGSNFGRPVIRAVAASGNVSLGLSAQGTGGVLHFYTNNTASEQMRVAHTASAVNYLQATGGATGNGVTLSAQGSDSNVQINILAKGAGGVSIGSYSGKSGLFVSAPSAAVNYVQADGANTGTAPTLSALGSDTNINLNLTPKGTGVVQVNGNINVSGLTASKGVFTDASKNLTSTGTLGLDQGGTGATTQSGAANAILPSQTGNNGKVLSTVGTNVSWIASAGTGTVTSVNASGGTTGLTFTGGPITAAGTLTLGGTLGTANGGTGLTSFTANGLVYASSTSALTTGSALSFTGTQFTSTVQSSFGGAVGSESLRVTPVASAVNYINVQGNITGNGPALYAQGSDTNIALNFASKGSLGFGFFTVGGTTPQFSVAHTASAVNYLQVTGGATGNGPLISTQGSDTNISTTITSKGNGIISLTTSDIASGLFGLEIGANNTGDRLTWIDLHSSVGTDYDFRLIRLAGVNAAVNYTNAGTGPHQFVTNAASEQFRISHTASAVNYLQVTGGATGSYVTLSGQGSDANVFVNYWTKGNGGHDFKTGSGVDFQFRVAHTASAVNYVQVTGGATGNETSIAATGSDADVNLAFRTKASGVFRFATNNGTNEQFRISPVASSVNYWNAYGAATTGYPTLQVVGTDTNIGFVIAAKGTSPGVFQSNSTQFQNIAGQAQFLVTNTTSAVNYLQASGGITGSGVNLAAGGSDTNIDLNITPKGTGKVVIANGISGGTF